MLKIIIFLYLLCIGRTGYRWTDPRRWIKSSNVVFSLWGEPLWEIRIHLLERHAEDRSIFLALLRRSSPSRRTDYISPPTSGGAGFIGAGFIGGECCFRCWSPASWSLPGGAAPPHTKNKQKRRKWFSAFLLIRLSGFAGHGDRHLLKRQYAFWCRRSVAGQW